MHQNQAKTSMKTIQNHIKNYWTLQYYDIFWCTRISGVNKRWAIESSTFRKFVEKFWKGGLGERRKKGRGGEKEEERETRGKKKRENGEEKKRNCERSRRKPKMIGERYENERRTFPPPLSCHYLKSLKFVWGVPKWKFLRGEKWKMGNSLTLTSPTFDCTPLTMPPDQNASK